MRWVITLLLQLNLGFAWGAVAPAAPITDFSLGWFAPINLADWTSPAEIIDWTSTPLLADWTSE